jgi:hypothetical protein
MLQEPEWFTTAPAAAIPLALQRAGLHTDQVRPGRYHLKWRVRLALQKTALGGLRDLSTDSTGGHHNTARAIGEPNPVETGRMKLISQRGIRQNSRGLSNALKKRQMHTVHTDQVRALHRRTPASVPAVRHVCIFALRPHCG